MVANDRQRYHLPPGIYVIYADQPGNGPHFIDMRPKGSRPTLQELLPQFRWKTIEPEVIDMDAKPRVSSNHPWLTGPDPYTGERELRPSPAPKEAAA